jgi:hypothetical protein
VSAQQQPAPGSLAGLGAALRATLAPNPARGVWVNLTWPPVAEAYLRDDTEPRATVKWEPRDAWVGAYIAPDERALYVCLVPFIVARVRWGRPPD